MPVTAPAESTIYPELIGHAPLMQMMFDGDDLAGVAADLLSRAEQGPAEAEAMLDLASVLMLRGDRDTGLAVQGQALQIQRLYHLPARKPATLRVLVLMAPGDFMANTPIEFLLRGSDVSMDLLYVAPDLPLPSVLPPHDLVFVAVSESGRNAAVLSLIASLLPTFAKPVVNDPRAIGRIARDVASLELSGIEGLVYPPTVRAEPRHLLRLVSGMRAGAWFDSHAAAATPAFGRVNYPLILRPVDSHAGQGLLKVDDAQAVDAYLASEPAYAYYAAPFVDYRSDDGLYRKYRIVFTDGEPHLCHMAISSHWMVHYLNAGMTIDGSKRDEEARTMKDFSGGFAERHRAAFDGLVERMGLDYVGIDCAETPDGELLVFEVANAMVVHAMDPAVMFPYKHEQMASVFGAFQDMLKQRAVDTREN